MRLYLTHRRGPIWLIDRNLTNTNTPGQNGPENNFIRKAELISRRPHEENSKNDWHEEMVETLK